MFCDLVGSTPLSEKLDPEELREVILAYQQSCAEAIRRFEGYLARYVGDGLLVYFGYPQAHEDDAQRAVRAGLGMVAALPDLNHQVQQTVKVLYDFPLQVRLGIHTGLVVVGDMGGGGYRDPMAIVGETPNIAARVQGIAEPNTVMISEATARLVQGLFECQARGPQALKGVSTPVPVYHVLRESEAQSRFEVAVSTGLTPLVGREEELGLLRRRWEQAKTGEGQAVLLSGEAGIGKSRLVQTLKEQAITEGATRIEFRCSPYHQNSAFYPIIEHLQQLLQFHREEEAQAKLAKLRQVLAAYRFPRAETLPLLAALLSLPHPEGCAPLTFSPQKQKQKTQEALVAWMVEEAEKTAVYCAWEDLHWADPSTLEVLTLFFDQVPTTRLLTLLTFRPDFIPPWRPRSHLTQLTLTHLGRPQVEAMVELVTGGKAFPAEVLQQIVALAEQGQGEEGITQIRQGLVAYQATGAELFRPYFLALLAETYGKMGQCEEGLTLLTEALAAADKNGERFYEAEVYRLKGQLTLEAGGWRLEAGLSSQAPSLKPPVSQAVAQEVEGYFLQAIEIARRQQAKSLELRAVISLSRLWQQQGKKEEARRVLAEIYDRFTEGFDTKDLQEAKALLEELA
jgi:class 3 adenylate cyclase